MSRLRFAVLLLVASPAAAADKLPPELALIPPDAAAFVSVRYDLLNATALGKAPVFGAGKKPGLVNEIETRWLGFPVAEVERVTLVYPAVPRRLTIERMPLFVVTRTRPIDRSAVVEELGARPLLDSPDDRGPERRRGDVRRGELFRVRDYGALCFVGDRSVLLASDRGAHLLFAMLGHHLDPSGEAPLAPALAAAEKSVVVAGATGAAFKALAGQWPDRDREFAALGRASAVTVVGNLEPQVRLTVRAEFADQASAREGQAALAAMTGWAAAALKELAAGPDKVDVDLGRLLLAALKDAGEPVREGKTVTVTVRMKPDEFNRAASAFGRAAVDRIRTAAERMKSSNNLKQMGLAIHNFHDVSGEFPFAARANEGIHPGLSWRVAILPFIEQDNLYKQLKLDEPWDSEHNKQFIDKMPKLFSPPPGVEAKPGHTFYRMFDGPGTMFRMKAFTDIKDGSSNTIMVVEAGEPVIWTKPDELEFDPKQPLPKLGGHFADGFNVLLADGSVRFVRRSLDERTLKALITADGAEDVSLGKD